MYPFCMARKRRFAMMFTENEFRAAEVVAARDGVSLASLVRQLLSAHVQNPSRLIVPSKQFIGEPPARATSPKPKGATR